MFSISRAMEARFCKSKVEFKTSPSQHKNVLKAFKLLINSFMYVLSRSQIIRITGFKHDVRISAKCGILDVFYT